MWCTPSWRKNAAKPVHERSCATANLTPSLPQAWGIGIERCGLWVCDNSEGLTETRIAELESQINKGRPFPKVFREFLYLAGVYNSLGMELGADVDVAGDEYIKEIDYYEKEMKKYGVSLTRPYVIFDSLDDACFTFIYLDEGDDPKPYNFGVHPRYRGDNGEVIYELPLHPKFSVLINDLVDRALKGLQPS